MRKILLPFAMLFILITNVSAAEYTIKIGTEYKSNIGWGPQRIDLLNTSNPSVSLPGGLTISLVTPNYCDGTTLWFNTIPSQGAQWLTLANPTTCLKGNLGDNTLKCKDDPNNATEGTTRLILKEIIPQTTSTTSTTSLCSNSSVIDVYVSTPGEPRYIKNNDIPVYDVKTFSSTTGWTSTVSDEYVNLYVRNNCNYETGIDVQTTGKYSGPYFENNNNIIRYKLESNDKYLFNVAVKQSIGSWNNNQNLKYGIVIKGLASSSSSCNLLIPAPYEVTLGNSKDLTLPDGEFTPLAGFTSNKISTADGKTNWKVGFTQVGTYSTVYTPASCSPSNIVFNVIPNVPTPAPTTIQSVTGAQNVFSDDLTKTIVIIIAFILLAAAVILFLKNRKRGGKFRNQRGDEESGAT